MIIEPHSMNTPQQIVMTVAESVDVTLRYFAKQIVLSKNFKQ